MSLVDIADETIFRFRHWCRGATRKFTVFSTLDEKKKIESFGAGFSGHFQTAKAGYLNEV